MMWVYNRKHIVLLLSIKLLLPIKKREVRVDITLNNIMLGNGKFNYLTNILTQVSTRKI